MPCDRVNQTRLAVEYAVPTPSLALEVQRGGIPGRPKATPALVDLSSLIASPQIERSWIKEQTTDTVTRMRHEYLLVCPRDGPDPSSCNQKLLPFEPTAGAENEKANEPVCVFHNEIVHTAQIAIGTLHLVRQNFIGAPEVRIPFWLIRLFEQRRFDRPICGPAVMLCHADFLLAVYR